MKTIIELITDEIKNVFAECGYDEAYAKVTVSNRPDLCEFQCNGAMAAAKAYKKAPFMIADEVVAKLADNKMFSKIESVKPDLLILIYVKIIWQDILMRCLKLRSSAMLIRRAIRLLLWITAELMPQSHFM